MATKLATFRADGDTWEKFQDEAKKKGTNASALLQRFVKDYIDGNLDNRIDSAAAPSVGIDTLDLKTMIVSVLNDGGLLNDEIATAINKTGLENKLNQIEIFARQSQDASNTVARLEALVEDLQQRLVTLEAAASPKKSLTQFAREKLKEAA